MSELGYHFGEGPGIEPPAGPRGPDPLPLDPVARAELRRSRQAVFGAEVPPRAALFAGHVARAVADGPALPGGGRDRLDGAPESADADPRLLRLAEDPDAEAPAEHADSGPHVLPAVREAAFGTPPTADGRRVPEALSGPEIVPLPSAPALVCDRSERIVRVNAALLRLAGRPADGVDAADSGLFGMRLPQLVVGPDADARLVRADGTLVRVRVVRWDLPGRELHAIALVELGEARPVEPGRTADRRWIAELEGMARVGTWSYELATATLRRSETLQQLYRSVGIDPERGPRSGSGPVEGEQVALLCQGLRSGTLRDRDHHVELQLPGDRRLSCRAEVECAADGTPVRLVGVVRDVSAQRAAEGRLRHSNQRFVDLLTVVPSGVVLLDPGGRVIDANPGMCALLDVPLERLRGTPATALAAEAPPAGDPLDPLDPIADTAPLPGWLRRVPPGARHRYTLEAVPLLRGDGTTVWCELAGSVTVGDDGNWFWMLVCTDIGERRRAAELLRSAGTVDELTRLPNRAASIELLERLLAGRERDRVAVACGDLDDFQRVNSSLGHDAGDDLLVTLAARLQRELPVGCTAARLAGDEFVVVCADHTEVGGPAMLARIVADLLRTTLTVHGSPVQMTASVGVATPPPSGDVPGADLLRFAEAAMHDAKRREHRGGIAVATDGVVSSATAALELEAELRAAIHGDALVLDYQPVVAADGTVLTVEALVRWQHPQRGLIAPADFLPVAQRSGLLRELDLWVLRAATREAATWPAGLHRAPAVAVNLAGLLPGEIDFLPAVTEVVADSGLPWDRLVLELVETSLVALPPHALAAMAELVARGVRFAVDDFGTGYSSLARLKELPAQTVKLDRAFVTGVADDPVDLAVARAVVDMARAMGRTTVAEGVETASQFHVLRGIGVDAYQGWLFARPLASTELHVVLAGGGLPTPVSGLGI
jgi:diguanylate cyclase (GGDEF)-like protein